MGMVPLDTESNLKHGQRSQSPNVLFWMSNVACYIHFKSYLKEICALVIKIDFVTSKVIIKMQFRVRGGLYTCLHKKHGKRPMCQ